MPDSLLDKFGFECLYYLAYMSTWVIDMHCHAGLILCHFKFTFEGWGDSSVGKDMYLFNKGPSFSSWQPYRSPQTTVSNPSSRRLQCHWLPWYLYLCVCMWTFLLLIMNSHLNLPFWKSWLFLLGIWNRFFILPLKVCLWKKSPRLDSCNRWERGMELRTGNRKFMEKDEN